mmetsp:Transcript_27877/g.68544  ORF Transcript_27877/g.68544 Transcript_27877/m.68544 type:complete len:905 (-) Transcript_27877:84-2798(-)
MGKSLTSVRPWHEVLDPKAMALSDANAIARYLSGGTGGALIPASGAARWATERWTEWEANVLAPAVAVACASKDCGALAALLAPTIDTQLSGGATSIAGGDTTTAVPVTLADVVVWCALYPVLAEGGVPGGPAALHPVTVVWFNALAAHPAFVAGVAASRSSGNTAAQLCAADGQAMVLEQLSQAPPVDPSGEKFCITTAINYANGVPHMGHAYEGISTDVIARYHRAYGRKVLFQTGADEHGQKIAEAAEVAGVKPIDLCNKYVKAFKELNERVKVSYDVYNRTTSEEHKKACATLFNMSKAAGDIYLDTYEGWYNVREETFVTETDAAAADYMDTVSGKPLKKMKEESYFFRQSRYQQKLIDHIEQNAEFIQPTKRRNEILARLREEDFELRDLSVSRTTFDWGIPVPDAPGHVMYVWFDALTNYLTGTGWPDKPTGDGFWPADVHIIGKDIIWFHCVIWPCMLWSAGLPLPTTVFGHGFVTAADGVKMSKSIGNVIDPLDVLQKYSPDTFRYYLMRNGVYGSDIPFSESNMVYVHNSDLADVMGNLVHRATNLCNKNCEGVVPACAPEEVFNVAALRVQTEGAMKGLEVQRACELAINAMKDTNKYLTESAPWAVKGDGAAERKAVIIRSTLEAVYVAAHFLAPFIPDATDAIFQKLGTPAMPLWKLQRGANLAPGTTVSVGDILFAKHEVEGEASAAGGGEQSGAAGGKGTGAAGGKGGAAAAPVAKKKEPAADAPVDVSRLDIRVGTIVKVWRHPDAEKLYVESIDIGEASGPRQVVSGLVDHIREDAMLGARVVVVANMKPSKMRGVESQAMVLCGTGTDGKTELVVPPEGVPNGERVVFDKFPGDADDQLNPKKKVFEAVSPGFEITAEGVASYQGCAFTTSKGVCKLTTLTAGNIK